MRYLLQIAAIALCASTISGLASPQPLRAQVFTEPAKPAAKKPRARVPAPTPAPRRRGARATAAEAAPPPPPPPSFNEPDAYCAVNPDADGPGPDVLSMVPTWLANGWKVASGNAQPAGSAAIKWKCSGGKVLACGSTDGQDMCSKPEPLTTATEEMIAYCADKRKGAIPRETTGNTQSVWVCKNRKPAWSGTRTDIDANGYLTGTWLDITPFSPANMVGDVPRAYVANWAVPVKVGFFGSMIRSGAMTTSSNPTSTVTTFSSMQITGGIVGAVIGTNIYYGESPGQSIAPTGCEAKLILAGVSRDSITVTERYVLPQPRCRKPETYVLQARDGQLLVNWMASGKTKPKRTEWVQPFQ